MSAQTVRLRRTLPPMIHPQHEGRGAPAGPLAVRRGQVYHSYRFIWSPRMMARPTQKPLHVASNPRVLVMDDEDTVRETLCRMVAGMGYDAAGAPDGSEALLLFSKGLAEGRPFSAVVLDLEVHDGLGGEATLAALKKLDPQVRAIASTGSGFDSERAFLSQGFSAALCKPYSMEELASALARIILDDES